MRVLVVENDPSIAALLADLMADEGHAVGGAATSDEGLARARAGPWDACLTDGFWPEAVGEGRDYLTELGSCCPVVLLSARPWARSARPADLGVAAVVPKPFDLDALLGTLAAVGDGRATTASRAPARAVASDWANRGCAVRTPVRLAQPADRPLAARL